MNILVLAPQPFFQNRGTPIAVRLLVEELAAAGHDIDLLAFHEGQDVTIPSVSITRIPAMLGLSNVGPGFSGKKVCCDALLAMKSVGLVLRHRYDMIHAVEESVFIALGLKKLFGLPYVYDMDSCLSRQLKDKYGFLEKETAILEWFEKIAIRCSSGVIAVCRSLEEMALALAPDKPVLRLEDISLLGSGPESGEDIRREYGISGPIVMYIGNLESYQGIDLLLESFALIDHAAVKANLVIIGGNEKDIARYRKKTGQLQIRDRVYFLGPRPVDQLGWYLRQADILVSPRIQGNNTPMKIYSYLDSGRPVLATRLPTHTQVLEDSIAMLASTDSSEFMQAMVTLILDAEKRSQLASAAAERVKKEFSRPAFRRKLISFYKDLENEITHSRRCV